MSSVELSDLALRTHRSVQGQTENLVELWHAHEHMRAPINASLLNAVAPHLFGTLHRCAFQCVLLLLRQLTEPATSRVRRVVRVNSSLDGLLHVTYGDRYETVAPELRSIAARAKRAAEPASEWVDKLVAHTDLLVGLKDEVLPTLPWPLLQISIDLVVEFVNAFETATGLPHSSFDQLVLASEVAAMAKALRGGAA